MGSLISVRCFVHQMIHSKEFVLAAVSNTASYLRLWALRCQNLVLIQRSYGRSFLQGPDIVTRLARLVETDETRASQHATAVNLPIQFYYHQFQRKLMILI